LIRAEREENENANHIGLAGEEKWGGGNGGKGIGWRLDQSVSANLEME
ncbi:hypothetical protein Trydic_g14746, partial [Trypoxylus dichotomus]